MPAPTPTPGGGFPDATPMTLEQYTALLAKWRADGSFDPLAKMLFGTDIFALADNWYRMTPEQGQAWQQSEAANYGRLMRYLRWLATMVNPANALRSIPQGANPASRPPVPNPLPSRG